ncbi:hypothetical protein D3C72_1756250 [compost metagenome]
MLDRHGVVQGGDRFFVALAHACRRSQCRGEAEEAVVAAKLVGNRRLKTRKPARVCRADQGSVESRMFLVPLVDLAFGDVFDGNPAARQPVVRRDDGGLPCAVALFDRLDEQRYFDDRACPGEVVERLA